MPTKLTPKKIEKILAAEGVRVLQKDIRALSLDELRAHFSFATKPKIVTVWVVKSLIWQAHTKIKSGEWPQVDGNLRSFWYSNVKSTISKIGALDDAKDPYDVMLYAFVDFTEKYRLFKYKDFGFTDENWENRRIGVKHPNIIVFSEKAGFVRLMREVNKTYDCTTAALNGISSVLSSEYMMAHIAEAGVDLGKTRFHVFGIVDYDPNGAIVAGAFQRQIKSQGVKLLKYRDLVTPAIFTRRSSSSPSFRYRPNRERKIGSGWSERAGSTASPSASKPTPFPRTAYSPPSTNSSSLYCKSVGDVLGRRAFSTPKLLHIQGDFLSPWYLFMQTFLIFSPENCLYRCMNIFLGGLS